MPNSFVLAVVQDRACGDPRMGQLASLRPFKERKARGQYNTFQERGYTDVHLPDLLSVIVSASFFCLGLGAAEREKETMH